MESESARTVESLNEDARFRAAIEALQARATEPDDGGFPFVEHGSSKIELAGDSSIIFDLDGTATETPRRTRYSIGNDGRMYGAVEGEALTPIGDTEASSVLGVLESSAQA